MFEGIVLIVTVFIIGPAWFVTAEWIGDLLHDRAELRRLYSQPDVYTEITEILRALPEENATTSRDFGRGYAKAIRDAVAVIDEITQVDSYVHPSA